MPAELARQWFVSSEGIDRHVIVTDIQRYLGNDATVRPGMGTGENEGVQGYWIKAYRNLTTAMISDLRADSQRWRQEQRMNGTTRASYVDSNTYQVSNANRQRPGGESPAVESGYGAPASRAPTDRMVVDRMPPMDRMPVDRMPVDRMPVDRMPVDRMPVDNRRPPMDRRAQDATMMDVDTPVAPPQRYASDRNGYASDPRQFPSDSRTFPADGRSGYPPRDPRDPTPYGRSAPAVSSPYVQEPMYGSTAYAPPPGDVPPGYVQRGGFYVPVSGYDQAPIASRADPSLYGVNHYGQPPPQRHDARDARDMRDPRDPREQRDHRDTRDSRDSRDPRDSRYVQDYQQDPRYAYPSPVPTIASVNPRERESVASPPQPRFADNRSPSSSGGLANGSSGYGMPPSYDQYGGSRPVQFSPGQPEQKYGSSQPSREQPGYGRDRPAAPSSNDGRDARRRRMN